jgi:hypothetical protein
MLKRHTADHKSTPVTFAHDPMLPYSPLIMLVVLAIPIACIVWTVTHEELFREPREWCQRRSERARSLAERKFFYLFTCEYCFSHYVVALFLIITHFTLIFDDWRGYLISGFSLVWIANVYMTAFGRLRLDLKYQRVEIAVAQEALASPVDAAKPATIHAPEA